MKAYTKAAPNSRNRHKRTGHIKHRFRVLLVLVVALLFAGHLAWSKHVAAETAATRRADAQTALVSAQKANLFAAQMQTLLAANPSITASVVTISGTDGLKQYGFNGVFDGASTAKLLSASDYLRHVEAGTAGLNQDIDGQTAESWLRAMIVNSDDTAWQEINNYLGHDDLARYASSIGFTNYDPSVNTFTSQDMALLLQKIYDRQLLNNADRSLLLRYMSEANYRDYIVAAVPSSDTVYHKAGFDNDDVHDAAIISNGQKSLVLVIFTNGNGNYDWGSRADLMRSITKDAIAAYL